MTFNTFYSQIQLVNKIADTPEAIIAYSKTRDYKQVDLI